MTDSEFDHLLDLYQRDKLTEKQRALVEKWLEKRAANRDAIVWSDKKQAALGDRLMQRIRRSKAKERTLLPVWFKAAAAVALLVTASVALWQWNATDMLHVSTLAGTQKVILSDGSIIWLKENSSLSYPEKFNGDTRNISFTGEALFEIAKDKDHPFIIQSGTLTTTVLGTSFNIKTTQQDIEVTVLTGRVALASEGKETLVVTANEKALYRQEARQLAKVLPQPAETTRLTEGTEYNMVFKDARMSEIVRRIENKFNVNVMLSDAGMNNCQVTGNFTDHSLNETLGMIAKTLGITYEVSNREVKLSGEGCP
jgi:ferric-dicitrate binding protein FerR (iron transport regulator)